MKSGLLYNKGKKKSNNKFKLQKNIHCYIICLNYINKIIVNMDYKKIKSNEIKFTRAILNDDYDKAKKILKKDFKINRDACYEIFNKGNIKYYKLALENRENFSSIYHNYPIKAAAENGHTEMVRLLLEEKIIDISYSANFALASAVVNGHTEIVRMLINDERLEITRVIGNIILMAFEGGHIEVAYLLWKNELIKTNTYTVDKENKNLMNAMNECDMKNKIKSF